MQIIGACFLGIAVAVLFLAWIPLEVLRAFTSEDDALVWASRGLVLGASIGGPIGIWLQHKHRPLPTFWNRVLAGGGYTGIYGVAIAVSSQEVLHQGWPNAVLYVFIYGAVGGATGGVIGLCWHELSQLMTQRLTNLQMTLARRWGFTVLALAAVGVFVGLLVASKCDLSGGSGGTLEGGPIPELDFSMDHQKSLPSKRVLPP